MKQPEQWYLENLLLSPPPLSKYFLLNFCKLLSHCPKLHPCKHTHSSLLEVIPHCCEKFLCTYTHTLINIILYFPPISFWPLSSVSQGFIVRTWCAPFHIPLEKRRQDLLGGGGGNKNSASRKRSGALQSPFIFAIFSSLSVHSNWGFAEGLVFFVAPQ